MSASLTQREMLEKEYVALHGAPPKRLTEFVKACEEEFEQPLAHAQAQPPGQERDEELEHLARQKERALLRAFYRAVHQDRPRMALCLSGGGIRSATFNLGVLAALANKKLLGEFDYLSTVSGGGYIGSWLTAWIHRDPRGRAAVLAELGKLDSPTPPAAPAQDHSKGAGNASGATAGNGAATAGSRRGPTRSYDLEAAPVQYLRQYSNYLTPRMGILRADSATLIATYLRNLLLNWMVLLPVLVAALVIPRIYVSALYSQQILSAEQLLVMRSIAQGLLAVAIIVPILCMPAGRKSRRIGGQGPAYPDGLPAPQMSRSKGISTPAVLALVMLPLMLSCLLLSFCSAWSASNEVLQLVPRGWKLFGWLSWGQTAKYSWLAVYAIPPVAAYVINKKLRQAGKIDLWCILALTASGLVVGQLFVLLQHASWWTSFTNYPRAFCCIRIPIGFFSYFVLATLYVGLTSGRPGGDEDREWWGRLMGWTLMIAAMWLALFVIALWGPRLVDLAIHDRNSALIVWSCLAVITAIAVAGGHSDSTSAQQVKSAGKLGFVLEAGPILAAQIAVPAIFVLLAWSIDSLLAQILPLLDFTRKQLVLSPEFKPFTAETFFVAQTSLVLSLFVVESALALIAFANASMNFNRFSLHAIYRDRLVRAFLGASNATRRADAFTGFDPEDNIPMHHLRRGRQFTRPDLDIVRKGKLSPRRVRLLADLLVNAKPEFFTRLRQLDDRSFSALDAAFRALKSGSGDRDARMQVLVDRTLDFLNVVVLDPRLCYPFEQAARSKWKKNEPGHDNPEIDLALRGLRYDRFPALVNRLLLEQYCVTGAAQDEDDGDGDDGGVDDNVYLLKPNGQSLPPKPLHVVNMALNLVDTRNLAWQQRKAASFTATPLHCGFYKGYRSAVEYGGPMTLGTAMTISGAAASPNMGYHSSPAVTFLMTLFNVRLGWWLGNPAEVKPSWIYRTLGRFGWKRDSRYDPNYEIYRRADPVESVGPLINEALGRTNDEFSYVYLSDGGHFDNLGLYEMVRRRCRFIVVSDASPDPNCCFDDLGNALRKVYNDFGISIVMHEAHFFPEEKRLKRNKYCAIGEIRYKDADGADAPSGFLIYLKPSRHLLEPMDVHNHALSNKHFPHEPTSNQWFSESQFESYRRLGFDTVMHLFSREPTKRGVTGERMKFRERIAKAIAKLSLGTCALDSFLQNVLAEATDPPPPPAQSEHDPLVLVELEKLGVTMPTEMQARPKMHVKVYRENGDDTAQPSVEKVGSENDKRAAVSAALERAKTNVILPNEATATAETRSVEATAQVAAAVNPVPPATLTPQLPPSADMPGNDDTRKPTNPDTP